MKWTDEKPKEVGRFWRRHRKDSPRYEWCIVMVFDRGNGGPLYFMYDSGLHEWSLDTADGQWSDAPIPEPED